MSTSHQERCIHSICRCRSTFWLPSVSMRATNGTIYPDATDWSRNLGVQRHCGSSSCHRSILCWLQVPPTISPQSRHHSAHSIHSIKQLPSSNCYLCSRFTHLVPTALCLGRHVDTALAYGNQRGVGRALAAAGVPRAEYFITSKVPGLPTPLPQLPLLCLHLLLLQHHHCCPCFAWRALVTSIYMLNNR